ncbi:MAG: hypothetical protein CSB33_03130 [Desulfobacterales bacterium]|nr:MAG: hypothetical protein CSB33_03130 [Desulfobacterales bacterium]
MTIDRQDIINFFLGIYKTQMGVPGAPGRSVRLEEDTASDDHVYELSLKKDGRTLTRRMSIGLLGENAGSKSVCYKVIYGDLLVLKIPPKPITSFQQYLAAMKTERLIARKLDPDIQTITPGAAALLCRLAEFSPRDGETAEAHEDRCIQILQNRPDRQEFLKIRGRFVLFMNLARHPFLGQVMIRMFDIKQLVWDEILKQQDALADSVLFEDVCGAGFLDLFDGLHTAFQDYDAELTRLAESHCIPLRDLAHHKRALFQARLAEQPPPELPGMPAAFTQVLKSLGDDLYINFRPTILRYRKLASRLVFQRTFEQRKPIISGLLTNLLSMLACLRRHGVAMRDLKPDNIYIVNDASATDASLSLPRDYAVGLIDFETAVDTAPEQGDTISQPMLGGTPSYATPAHLVTNEVLAKTLGSVQRSLHIQDWQAMTGILFKLVTGKHLYWETGRLLPRISDAIRRTVEEEIPKTRQFQLHSRIFWYHALREYTEKRGQYREMMTAVRVDLPWSVKKMIGEELEILMTACKRRYRKLVYSQEVFRSEQTRKKLLAMSVSALDAHRRKWESGDSVPGASVSVRVRVIRLMSQLSGLKQQMIRLDAWRERLKDRSSSMSSYDLLDIMQQTVFQALYREEWGKPVRAIGDISINKAAGPRTDETIINTDETAALEDTVRD